MKTTAAADDAKQEKRNTFISVSDDAVNENKMKTFKTHLENK